MTDDLWARRPLPRPGTRVTVVGRWQPTTLAELTAHRRRLAETLHGDARPADVDEGAVERLLLVYEELGSNALRHGRRPVHIVLSAFDGSWLIEVSDAAGDRAPTPAIDRDAAEGGLGLYLVARVCGAHGWTEGPDGRKHVWAQIDHTRRDVSPQVWQQLPRPRSPRSRPSHDR